ncbi:potassium transporter Trk [Myxococcus sp. MISCRS1]|uniref:TrkH family potassium uptake protein n=1 Tax=Myxococcus TaxID=32 RepID=UPI001CBB55A4|nr:potassium transporter TrkG [Myxococcus sp. MISCRS1]MCY0997897.1 potassium transporter Trk [Myxococcus sp. MISCRS1]
MTPLLRSPIQWLWLRWSSISPAMLLALSFGVLIAFGTLGLLWLPGLYTGPRLGLLDALFTMTSAVCVTGLTVVDTATTFTRWGQLWLLVFIQLGGLGLITLATLVIGALGRKLSLRSEVIVGAPIDYTHRQNVVSLTLRVARFTLWVEALGALLLWLLWLPRFGWKEAAWHAVFHSVSAFCNAGFSTFSDSLVGFASAPLTLFIVSSLIILGGLGYLSGEEALRWWRGRNQRSRRMSVHTFAALLVTSVLLVGGAVLFTLFEWNGVLRSMGYVDRVANAWFMSATARTAGFNSVSYSEVSNASGFFTILLMVVGGSPGSTAGGLKTTTLAVLAALAFTRIRGRRHAELHGRAIPEGTIERTVSLALIAFGVMTAAVFALSFTEGHGEESVQAARASFLPLFFEVVSAFCTVGLTMDVSPSLSVAGKLQVIGLMFVGRLGPLAFFAALSLRARTHLRHVRPAQEDLIVG